MVGDRYSVTKLFKAYAAQKAGDEWHGEWGAALLYRPIAILATPALLRLSVHATAVTFISLMIVLSLPAFALYAGPTGYLAVGFLAMLVAILDCVDGTIARATDTISRFGHYLDFLTDIIFRISLYAAIGLIADLQHAQPRWLSGWAFGLAVLAASFAVAARLCRIYIELLTRNGAYESASKQDDRPGTSVAAIVFLVISGIDPLLPFFVLAAGAWNALGWVVMWLLSYSTLDFIYTQFVVLRRLR
jgi:phosphatidylglycerophosphate synthase